MKKLLLLFGLSLLIFQSNAQDLDSIQFIGKNWYHGDVLISRGTIKTIVMVNPVAYQEVKRGNSRITWGYVVGITGGVLIGGGIGSLIVGKEYEGNEGYLDPLTGIGVGTACFVGGLLLLKSGAIKLANGVDIYNSNISSNSASKPVSLNLGLSKHGVGLTVTF